MKKKDLIVKWLDYEPLNESESEVFKNLDASDSFFKIAETAKKFRAPDFNVDDNLELLTAKLKDRKEDTISNKSYPFLPWMWKIAAIFIIGIGLYTIFSNSHLTTIHTLASEKSTITLPDESTVVVNALSSIIYKSKDWDNNRTIDLDGEAFFKVAKGKKFDVTTDAGTVTVLGTQFNVKSRENYFEVTCYEGLVKVTHAKKELQLSAGQSFLVINGKATSRSIQAQQNPDWTNNKSTFRSVPLHFVLKEFERQYDSKIIAKNIDQNIVFTGNFVHSDFRTALQSITIPMRLTYVIDNNLITLDKE